MNELTKSLPIIILAILSYRLTTTLNIFNNINYIIPGIQNKIQKYFGRKTKMEKGESACDVDFIKC